MDSTTVQTVAQKRTAALVQLLAELGNWNAGDLAAHVLEQCADLPEGVEGQLDALSRRLERCALGEELLSVPLCGVIAQVCNKEPVELYVELEEGPAPEPVAVPLRGEARKQLIGLRAEALKAALAAKGMSISAVVRAAVPDGVDAAHERQRLLSRLSNAQNRKNLLNDQDIARIAPILGVQEIQLRIDGEVSPPRKKREKKPKAEALKPEKKHRKKRTKREAAVPTSVSRPRPAAKAAPTTATLRIDPAKLLELLGQENVSTTLCSDGEPGMVQVCVTATISASRIPEFIAGE